MTSNNNVYSFEFNQRDKSRKCWGTYDMGGACLYALEHDRLSASFSFRSETLAKVYKTDPSSEPMVHMKGWTLNVPLEEFLCPAVDFDTYGLVFLSSP